MAAPQAREAAVGLAVPVPAPSARAARGLGAALLLLGVLVLGLDLTAAIGPEPAATACRLALSPACHQRPERSFAVAGRPLGACARCVGLHAGGVLAGLGLLLAAGRWRSRLSAPAVATMGLAPLAADALLGMAVPAWDHPAIRLATGVVAVVALAAAARAHPAPGPTGWAGSA